MLSSVALLNIFLVGWALDLDKNCVKYLVKMRYVKLVELNFKKMRNKSI